MFAVIGVGNWGKNHVREYLETCVDLTVCDIVKKKLEPYHKLDKFLDYKKIVRDENIKGVSICVPNQLHFEMAKDFLKAGKFVLLEKPMCLSSKKARELLEFDTGNKLTVGHIFRFNNALKKLREMIVSKELGKISVVKLTWTNLTPVYFDRDILTDLALHSFDIVNFLFDKNPVDIRAVGSRFRRVDSDETVVITGKIDSVLVEFFVSWCIPLKKREVIVVGSKKTIVVDALTQTVSVIDMKTGLTEAVSVTPNNPLNEEINAFIKTVIDGNPVGVKPEKGVEIIELIDSIQKELM